MAHKLEGLLVTVIHLTTETINQINNRLFVQSIIINHNQLQNNDTLASAVVQWRAFQTSVKR